MTWIMFAVAVSVLSVYCFIKAWRVGRELTAELDRLGKVYGLPRKDRESNWRYERRIDAHVFGGRPRGRR